VLPFFTPSGGAVIMVCIAGIFSFCSPSGLFFILKIPFRFDRLRPSGSLMAGHPHALLVHNSFSLTPFRLHFIAPFRVSEKPIMPSIAFFQLQVFRSLRLKFSRLTAPRRGSLINSRQSPQTTLRRARCSFTALINELNRAPR
jgi:hypothetical protein